MKPDFRNASFEMLHSEIIIDKSPEVDVESKWNLLKGKYTSVRKYCIQQKNVNLSKPEQPKWFIKDIAKQTGEKQKSI